MNQQGTLSAQIRRIYFLAIASSVAIVLTCYSIVNEVHKRQQLAEWQDKLSSLMDGQTQSLLQEFVNDRFYAAAMRGRKLHEENKDIGIEVGLYRVDGSTIYESSQMGALVKKIGAPSHFHQGKVGDVIVAGRNLRFAGELIGSVLFAASPSRIGSQALNTALWITLVVIIIVLLCIFVYVNVSFKRMFLGPMEILVQEIPSIGRFLDGQSNILPLPKELGSFELNRVSDTLLEMAERLKRILQHQKNVEIQAEKAAAVSEVSRQVAHDIRSPLTALSIAVENLSSLPEDQRVLLRSAAARIQDIANNLLNSTRANLRQIEFEKLDAPSCQLLSVLIEMVVSEKRFRFKAKSTVKILHHSLGLAYGLFAKVEPSAFKRILSNLIDNSIEAIGKTGEIHINIKGNPKDIEVIIQDNGNGIPSDVLPKLFQKGATFNKRGGSGLGLYSAKQCIENWGGRIILESKFGKGTVIKLMLPREKPPAWFVSELDFTGIKHVLILDDDESIHQVWNNRLGETIPSDISVHHLWTCEELIQWKETVGHSPSLYLIDHELIGQAKFGLDLIEELHLNREAVLVTSHFEDAKVRERCERLELKLIPKALAGAVPIRSGLA